MPVLPDSSVSLLTTAATASSSLSDPCLLNCTVITAPPDDYSGVTSTGCVCVSGDPKQAAPFAFIDTNGNVTDISHAADLLHDSRQINLTVTPILNTAALMSGASIMTNTITPIPSPMPTPTMLNAARALIVTNITVTISNTAGSSSMPPAATATATNSSAPSSSSESVIGASIGVTSLIMVVLFLMWDRRRRQRRPQTSLSFTGEEARPRGPPAIKRRESRLSIFFQGPFPFTGEGSHPRVPPAIKQYRAMSGTTESQHNEQIVTDSEMHGMPTVDLLSDGIAATVQDRPQSNDPSVSTLWHRLYARIASAIKMRESRTRTSIQAPFPFTSEESRPRVPPAIKQYRAMSDTTGSEHSQQISTDSEMHDMPTLDPFSDGITATVQERPQSNEPSVNTLMQWLYTAPLAFLVDALNNRLQDSDSDEERPPTYASRRRRRYRSRRRQASGRGRTEEPADAVEACTGGEGIIVDQQEKSDRRVVNIA